MDGDVSERFLLWTDESIWTVIGRVEQWFDKGLSKEDGHISLFWIFIFDFRAVHFLTFCRSRPVDFSIGRSWANGHLHYSQWSMWTVIGGFELSFDIKVLKRRWSIFVVLKVHVLVLGPSTFPNFEWKNQWTWNSFYWGRNKKIFIFKKFPNFSFFFARSTKEILHWFHQFNIF